MDESAVKRIEKLAITGCAIDTTDVENVNAIPVDMEVMSMERFRPYRDAFRGEFRTSSVNDFVRYVASNLMAAEGTEIFIDENNMDADCYLDRILDDNVAGHCRHVARLQMMSTEDYAGLRKHNTRRLSQKDMVDWFEDFAHCIPAAAEILPALRSIDIHAKSERGNDVENLRESRSSLEKIEASSRKGLPDSFAFVCQPYPDLKERTFDVGFRVHIHPDGDFETSYRIQAFERHGTDITEEFVGLLERKFEHVVGVDSIRRGTFSP